MNWIECDICGRLTDCPHETTINGKTIIVCPECYADIEDWEYENGRMLGYER